MRYIKDLLSFFAILIKQRFIIFQLAKRDFQNKYLASYLGLVWAFFQPAVSILVMWFVVTFGFKSGPVELGMPFGVWFMCGYVPWMFINDGILGGTNSLIEYSYLIKKVYFRPSIIPVIKIITAFIIHFFFIVLTASFSIGYKFYPTIYWLQLPYYVLCAVVLILGISWFTSAVTVFIRDMGQFVGVIMQVAFWATPIIWHHSMLQGNMRYILYLNPFYYIVNGYRETFFSQMWFFEHLRLTLYFWFVAGIFFIAGAMVFSKLKPHFADVM